MTLSETIRQVWPKVRATAPLPTTVAEVRALRDSRFWCPVNDQHMIHVAFHGRTVHVTLIDPVTRECDGGEFTAREFLDLIWPQLDTVPAGDLVTTRCRTCRTPVVPGHTGHDGPLVDGEETFWCDQCCPHCTNEGRRK